MELDTGTTYDYSYELDLEPPSPRMSSISSRRTSTSPSYTDSSLYLPTGKIHPLFIVADTLISFIDDYPTLVMLASTCYTFQQFITRRPTLLSQAFEDIEVDPNYAILPCENFDVSICVSSMYSWDRHIKHLPHNTGWDCRGSNVNLFRAGHHSLTTAEWFPCYECRRILPRSRSFFSTETSAHLSLLGCQRKDRKCIDCGFGQGKFTDLFSDPLRYLQDMPRGYEGFRLRCTQCRKVRWLRRQPRRRQKLKKLCAECFDGFLLDEARSPMQVMWEEWSVMAGMPFESSSDESNELFGEERKLELLCAQDEGVLFVGMNRFELLLLDAG